MSTGKKDESRQHGAESGESVILYIDERNPDDLADLAGWAISGEGIARVEVFVDDRPAGIASYGHARPDVGKAWPHVPGSEKSGFCFCGFSENHSVPEGEVMITVVATSAGGKSARAEKRMAIMNSPNVRIECERAEALCGSLTVSGFAISGRGIERVEIHVDGAYAGDAVYGSPRPDVESFWPYVRESGMSGFSFSCPVKRPGELITTVIRAITSDGLCMELEREVPPEDTPGIMVHGDRARIVLNRLIVSGFALSSGHIERIEILLGDRLIGCAPPGLPRPDLEEAYPHVPDSGFSGFRFCQELKRLDRRQDKPSVTIKAYAQDGRQGEARQAVEDHIPELPMSEVMSLLLDSPQEKISCAISHPVDIIVPVYNGLELLERLIPSIFRNTSIPFRLIIVDDCSTDSHVRDLLEGVRNANENVILMQNDQNQGFAASINKAVSLVADDFVILNTDTEVPPRWLERLMAPLRGRDDVASVTPFSNTGNACSFPILMEDNEMFEGLSLEVLDRYFHRINPEKSALPLPSGVGFCMALKKKVIDQAGLFDQETFGRGYGEETEWCQKARAAGFVNVIAANLFVYHAHCSSFSSRERAALWKENSVKLEAMHPGYFKRVEDFTACDPLRALRDLMVMLITSGESRRRPLLYIRKSPEGETHHPPGPHEDVLLRQGECLLFITGGDSSDYRLRYCHRAYDIRFTTGSIDDLVKLLRLMGPCEIAGEPPAQGGDPGLRLLAGL